MMEVKSKCKLINEKKRDLGKKKSIKLNLFMKGQGTTEKLV
jgi:hypothetical protein